MPAASTLHSPFVPVFGPDWSVTQAIAARRSRQSGPTLPSNHTVKNEAVHNDPRPEGPGVADLLLGTVLSAMGLHLLSEVLHVKDFLEEACNNRTVHWTPVRTIDVRALLNPSWYYRPEMMPDKPEAPRPHTIHQNLGSTPVSARAFGSFGHKARR